MESSVHQLLVHDLRQAGGELSASATSAWLEADRWRALCINY